MKTSGPDINTAAIKKINALIEKNQIIDMYKNGVSRAPEIFSMSNSC